MKRDVTLHKYLDIVDWGIRQMRKLGYLSMRQHILVLRLLLYAKGRTRRFSDKEIHTMCDGKVSKVRTI